MNTRDEERENENFDEQLGKLNLIHRRIPYSENQIPGELDAKNSNVIMVDGQKLSSLLRTMKLGLVVDKINYFYNFYTRQSCYCHRTREEYVSNSYPTQVQNYGTAHLLYYVISVYRYLYIWIHVK